MTHPAVTGRFAGWGARAKPVSGSTEKDGGHTQWLVQPNDQDASAPESRSQLPSSGRPWRWGCGTGVGGPGERKREPEPAGAERSAREREWCCGRARDERKLRDVRVADVSAADSAPRQPERRQRQSRSVLEHPGRVTVAQRERQRTCGREALRGLRGDGRQQEPTRSVPRRLGSERGLRVRHQQRDRTDQPGAHGLPADSADAAHSGDARSAADAREAGRGAAGDRSCGARGSAREQHPCAGHSGRGSRARCPFTGNELFVKLAVALLALSAGGAMVFVGRRRMTTA